MDYNKKALIIHQKNQGKITIKTKIKLKTLDDLSIAYTPGVGAVSTTIGKNLKKSWTMTNRANQVAIVSDGTAILGLGNLGPEAAMPVMEGKSAIFKEFAGVDAIPLCINTTDTEEIIKFCQQIQPSFGGINLEDISAPRCFDILSKLEKKLSIPIFHDDQDGTAIVVLAGLINACRITKQKLKNLKIIINGSGAAGISITRLLLSKGITNIILLDSKGIIYNNRYSLNKYKKEIAQKTNLNNIKGGLKEALVKADVFIGVSKGNLVTKEMIKLMNKNPIVFAMANPTPEINPNLALKAGASIVGTGRSDFPNQINNAIIFPGLFRGVLDKQKKVDIKLKIKIAQAVAYSLTPTKKKILPLITDKKLVKIISSTI